MAAGLGFKTFTTGEVLTAADTNGYLMQGILVFASEAARNSAITSPQEGQFAFTKDTNSTWYYDGAAWVASGASGDVTGVTAGTGITVASPTGPVPVVTNDMATTITAAGDIVVGTGSGTYDNLPIGTTAQVLTADTTVSPYKVKWAAVAGGSMTLLSTTTLSGSSTSITGISGSYKNLYIELQDFYLSAINSAYFRVNNDSTGIYGNTTKAAQGVANANVTSTSVFASNMTNAAAPNWAYVYINDYTGNHHKIIDITSMNKDDNGATYINENPSYSYYRSTSAITSFQIIATSGTWSAGTVRIYGVN
jgi:hypothetical protein